MITRRKCSKPQRSLDGAPGCRPPLGVKSCFVGGALCRGPQGEAAHFVNLRPAGKADGRGAKKEPAGRRLRTFTGLSRGAPPTL